MKFLLISAILFAFFCSVHAAAINSSETSRAVSDEAMVSEKNGIEKVLDESVKEDMEEEIVDGQVLDSAVKKENGENLKGTTDRGAIIVKKVCKKVYVHYKFIIKCFYVKFIKKCHYVKVYKYGHWVYAKKCKLVKLYH